MKRRPHIPPRCPIFLGCEGQSEQGYGALLDQLARELGTIHIHIYSEVLQSGAGSPSALLKRAVDVIADIERRRTKFQVKAILLDKGSDVENAAAHDIAWSNGIDHLIWQDPDHEAFILRHLTGCHNHQPPKGRALAEVQREWPEYNKAMPARRLAERINLEAVRAACRVETDLRLFLQQIRLI